VTAMTCGRKVRDRMNVKLDGWQAYVRAIGAQLDPDGNDALDRVQACKNRLREALERLERAAHEAKPLAAAARSRLCLATSRLRTELRTQRPHNAATYAEQKNAIAAAIRTAEAEMNAASLSPGNDNGRHLNAAAEQTTRAMLNLEAELDAAEVYFRDAGADDAAHRDREREIAERLRALNAAIAIARKLSEANAETAEAEIASGVQRLRELYVSLWT